MARVEVRAGRRPNRPPRSRGRIVSESLVAAGEPPMLTMYDMTRGTLAERVFVGATIEHGYAEVASASWPSEEQTLQPVDGARGLFREGTSVVYLLEDGSLAYFAVGGGWARAWVSGTTYGGVYGALAAFQSLYPATYLSATDARVPITFWTNTAHGPVRRLRMIDSAPWSAVEANYPVETRGQVATLMHGFEPGKSGQLILWQGPAGCGKTWALRALASEWLSFAEFHYITDPDSFFVDDPSYMVDVLLAETYDVIDVAGDVYQETDADGKWRVLILEDTGELLSANAKEKYGQGLSRLLNVVDGMIGQGLRVLCLVTTNDELGELNPAVRRPGRCAAQIVFPAFPADEASAWLGEDVSAPMTVAEMYARRGDALEAIPARDEPDDPEPKEASDLMASADLVPIPGTSVSVPRAALDAAIATAKAASVEDEVARVAEELNPLAVDYGQTAYDEAGARVLWVSGDGTSDDEVGQARDAFLAVDGVDDFDHEAEGMPDGWCDAKVVYGGDPFAASCDETAAIRAVVALAAAPLDV